MRGKPVWVVKRTPDMLAPCRVWTRPAPIQTRMRHSSRIMQERNRSIKPEILVLVGICTI